MVNDGPKYAASDGLTFVIWKNEGGVDVWTEGGGEESSGGGGNFTR
jgi:hypothetical protein